MSFLGAVIDDDWTGAPPADYVVTRRAPASNDGHGRRVAAAASSLTMSISIQPLTGRALATESTGRETREQRLAFTTDARLLDVETASQAADVVTISGEAWTVIEAEHWTEDGEVWTRAVLERTTTP